MGFEPMIQSFLYVDLANQCLKPLSHTSKLLRCAEGFSDQSIFDCRNQWRRIAFTPDTREQPIGAKAINKILRQNLTLTQSWKRILKALERGELHLKKKEDG